MAFNLTRVVGDLN